MSRSRLRFSERVAKFDGHLRDAHSSSDEMLLKIYLGIMTIMRASMFTRFCLHCTLTNAFAKCSVKMIF